MARQFLTPLTLALLEENPASPIAGQIYYNTTEQTIKAYNGIVWYDVAGPKEILEHTHGTDGAVNEYIKEINENFITCRYAPFSSQGGMLGYLFSGDPKKAFTNIETKAPCTLNDHPDFSTRDHKTSDHQRVVPPGKLYPVNFRCHHLLLKIIAPAPTDTSSV